MWFHPHQLRLAQAARGEAKHFDHYALNCVAARRDKFARPDTRNPNSPMAGIDYAYHFDAALYARFLRRRAEAQGVERIEGRIVDVRLRAATAISAGSTSPRSSSATPTSICASPRSSRCPVGMRPRSSSPHSTCSTGSIATTPPGARVRASTRPSRSSAPSGRRAASRRGCGTSSDARVSGDA